MFLVNDRCWIDSIGEDRKLCGRHGRVGLAAWWSSRRDQIITNSLKAGLFQGQLDGFDCQLERFVWTTEKFETPEKGVDTNVIRPAKAEGRGGENILVRKNV
jgi:hypothetical protein